MEKIEFIFYKMVRRILTQKNIKLLKTIIIKVNIKCLLRPLI
jgi:hypothetical protein